VSKVISLGFAYNMLSVSSFKNQYTVCWIAEFEFWHLNHVWNCWESDCWCPWPIHLIYGWRQIVENRGSLLKKRKGFSLFRMLTSLFPDINWSFVVCTAWSYRLRLFAMMHTTWCNKNPERGLSHYFVYNLKKFSPFFIPWKSGGRCERHQDFPSWQWVHQCSVPGLCHQG